MKRIKIRLIEIIKIILFIAIAGLILWYSSVVFGYEKGETSYPREKCNEYKSLNKNSLDVLFVGSSATDRYWVPAIGWHDAGFTSFDLTVDGGPINLYPALIDEALKTQSPKLIVIELRRAYRSSDSFLDFRVRRITDVYLKGRTLKTAAKEIYTTAEKYDDTDIDISDKSYRFPYLKNHNKWRIVEDEDYSDLFPKTSQMGYPIDVRTSFWKVCEQPYPELTEAEGELSEYSEDAINTILDYCDTLDCEVLFTLTPMSSSSDRLEELNSAKAMVTSRGYDVLDMNTEDFYDSVKLSFKTDFYNDDHTNFRGAAKITGGILEYIKENYALEDHRNDSEYEEEWGNIYEELKELVEKNRKEWLYLLD